MGSDQLHVSGVCFYCIWWSLPHGGPGLRVDRTTSWQRVQIGTLPPRWRRPQFNSPTTLTFLWRHTRTIFWRPLRQPAERGIRLRGVFAKTILWRSIDWRLLPRHSVQSPIDS